MPLIVVDWNQCSGKGTCTEVCPAAVFELQELMAHPETLKSVPVRMEECNLCMKCLPVCCEQAITIKKD